MAISLVATAVALIFGICTSNRFSPDFLALFFISYLLIWVISSLVKRSFNIAALVCVAAFVFGACSYRVSSNTELRECSRYTERYVTLTGRVSEIPTQNGDNMQYTVDAVSLERGGETLAIRERILLTSPESFDYNDTVVFSGFLKVFPERLNESGFDLLGYYKSRNIFFRMYSEDCKISDTQIKSYSVYALATSTKNSISQFIDKYNRGDKAAVLKAVLVGNKSELSDELYEVLLRTGTSRCLYPAFLHVMLIMSIIGLAAGFVKRRTRDVILIAALILYAMMNVYRPAFLRVTILAAATLIWKRRYGYADFKEMLSVTVIVICGSNPLFLFDGGFVLSVCAIMLIRCFFGYVYGKMEGVRFRYARRVFAVSTICTIGLLPLLAYYFGGASLYSAVSALLFIPAVAGILLSFPIVYAMTLAFGCAPLFGGFMTAMAYIIMYVPKIMDKLADAFVTMGRPTLVFCAAYAAAVIAAGFYVHNMADKAKRAAFVSAALFLSCAASQLARMGTVEISFVNVGQGDGALIEVPYRGAVIIDGGGGADYSDYNIGEKVFVPYLGAEGKTRLEAAFVSHYHKDHVEGVIAAIENLRVKNVFMPEVMPGNEWRRAIERAARDNNTKIHYISEDARVVFDSGLTVSAIVPAAKTALISGEENDASVVYKVEYGGFSCLFTGDMTEFAERNLIESGAAVESDVLKVAHHGSSTSTSGEWVEAVKPSCAVISVGEDNQFDFPHEEVLENLADTEVLRTDENGDIKIVGDKHGIKKINPYRR